MAVVSEGEIAIARVVVESRPFGKPGGENFGRTGGMLLRALADNRWLGKAEQALWRCGRRSLSKHPLFSARKERWRSLL